jgi:hypothetical protein
MNAGPVPVGKDSEDAFWAGVNVALGYFQLTEPGKGVSI